MALRTEAIKALREKRARLADEARKILEDAKTADGGEAVLTAESQKRFDDLHTEIGELRTRIEAEERQLDLDAELNEPAEVRSRTAADPEARTEVSADEARAKEKRYAEAFWRQARGRATAEDRELLASRYEDLTPEQRALATGVDAAGGYTVPEDFYRSLMEAMKAFGGVREAGVTVLPTTTGAPLPIPTSNDTGNKGAIIAENTQIGEQDVAFGQVTLGAFMYTSKIVRVSLQLLQDSAFDLESWLRGKLAERIQRITNEHFTTGTGVGQPGGLVVGSTLGKTGANGQTTAVTYDDFVDLEHSVDPAHRRNGRFMFHDSTLKAGKKLKDADGRPLWVPGVAVKEPDTLLGRPYTINQDMPVMAASAKSILFGDFSKYLVRDVLGFQLIIMREKYADYLQVGFLGFSRHDGKLVDAGSNPIKHYANSAA